MMFTNKIQSETADFAPLPTPDELDETYASTLILFYSLHENMTSSIKPDLHNIIALLSEEEQATAKGITEIKIR